MTIPKCEYCEHYYDYGEDGIDRCKAFPNGIPNGVCYEDEKEECNNGIKYEPIDKSELDEEPTIEEVIHEKWLIIE